MGRKKIIIHFGPPEWYPPLQNLIRVLEKADPAVPILLLTTLDAGSKLDTFQSGERLIVIKRLGRSGGVISKPARLFNYLFFYAGCSWFLLLNRPATVLYFETLSAFPAWLYKKFIRPKAAIMAHYHEYSTPQEYAGGMWLVRWFHKLEGWLYPRLAWLSHTNKQRLELFLKNISPITTPNPQVLPNYPPAAWNAPASKQPMARRNEDRLRLVYVGALSLDTMHTIAMAEWVERQEGRVLWDIYSYNHSAEAAAFLRNKSGKYIRLMDGVSYETLPAILHQYDVGLILYNGHIPNYIYNAPNKLFEYLVCGLDVWYPNEMIGCYEYDSAAAPRVIRLDFTNLDAHSPDVLIVNQNLVHITTAYAAEVTLKPMIKLLLT